MKMKVIYPISRLRTITMITTAWIVKIWKKFIRVIILYSQSKNKNKIKIKI